MSKEKKTKTEKKKYAPLILDSYKYRGYVVRERLNRKTRRREFIARFQFNNREFKPVADSRKAIEEIIDDLIYNERRAKANLAVEKNYPLLSEVVEHRKRHIKKPHRLQLFSRVSFNLLALLPARIKINELKRAHFQKYIDWRRGQTGVQSKKPVLDETIDKELYSISSMLADAPLYFAELEDWQKPVLPKAHKGKKHRRTRLVSRDTELKLLLAELRKSAGQNPKTAAHRRRLADDLEFRFETGLRRKEVAALKIAQYKKAESALRGVIRWKTNTVTKFFPLSRRAVEIIETRIEIAGGEFIFSPAGKPVESVYRTLRKICEKLKINYGKYAEGGFIPHDFRHNFASEIIESGADIETARELLGHSNIEQTGDYLHTTEKRLSEAVARRGNQDKKALLVNLYKQARRRKISVKSYLETLKKIGVF